ncbi:uncharacterized protein E6C27_scaffold616G00740 [Cucumis melo var. makuwa]|uniref:Reverse transcriptase domain-containing protein n=1 Tax=Cucumis melo var. makuwa TaxID=1194695 RepID=A0A5A7V9M6_CUCMM|nr:uncharacterized protein E6C27_scaffold616G00740 [Cucumis melo var. makuwa]
MKSVVGGEEWFWGFQSGEGFADWGSVTLLRQAFSLVTSLACIFCLNDEDEELSVVFRDFGVVNYFRNSLGSHEIGYRELSPVIDDIVQFRWSEECFQALQIPISQEEVRRVLFSMDSGKAPGPDGFSVGFFKGVWSVVGEDFCDAVLHFFETCYLPIGVNATAITLIPKRRGAERMEEFRPISCFNVIYKCISKILADRLRVWLPSFISRNQSAFISGRTYDSVNWDFLFGLLIAIGTPLKKGVRQGDHFSPFLFVMVMEVLSRMLNKIPQSFQFHHHCEKFKLTHLTFADDLMIFYGADEPSLSFIRECFRKFSELSVGYVLMIVLLLFSVSLAEFALGLLEFFLLLVDKILRSYLWRGKEEGRGGIKVAWMEVYLPFEEGGFAIRDGPSWNIASTLKILWLLLTSSCSLWVAWVEAYIPKGRSLWAVDSRVGRSWCLRAILHKQERLKHHVRMEVGDGSRCNVWLDPWLQGGPILEQAVSPCLSVSDRWVWVSGRQGGFSIASSWEAIRPRGGRVRWAGLLGGGVSRSLVLFVSVWGDVWSRILRVIASSHRIGHWGVELFWICHQGIGKGVRRKLWRVPWCATIYFIWNKWNHRLHGGQARDPIVLFHLICTCVRARAGSWQEDAQLLF